MKKLSNIKKTTEQFIQEAKLVHGNRYEYNKVIYKSNNTNTIIVCKEHGEFEQRPSSHLRGADCPECAKVKRGIGIRLAKTNRDWDFEQPEDYKLIPLTQGKYAKVDNEDFDRLKDINWYYTSKGYVFNNTFGLMHRLVMNAPDDMEVDHIEQEYKSDNRKSNLRLATRSQNSANARPVKGSVSEYKGVYWYAPTGKWKAQIKKNKKVYALGYFDTEEEAGRAYDAKALELFGDFAYLNFKD